MTPGVLESQDRHRLVELDAEVDELKEALDDAVVAFSRARGEVGNRPEVDRSIRKRLVTVADRLKDLQPEMKALDFDSEQQAALWDSILEVDQAARSDQEDLDRFEQMLLGVERVRQIIRDALDEFTGGGVVGRNELIRLIDQRLPGISRRELAALLGVNPRTISRWASQAGEPSHRLDLVAKLVQILLHAWTPAGVVAWFHKPRIRLDGKAPIELLDDPARERDLLGEARGGRNQYAA